MRCTHLSEREPIRRFHFNLNVNTVFTLLLSNVKHPGGITPLCSFLLSIPTAPKHPLVLLQTEVTQGGLGKQA